MEAYDKEVLESLDLVIKEGMWYFSLSIYVCVLDNDIMADSDTHPHNDALFSP